MEERLSVQVMGTFVGSYSVGLTLSEVGRKWPLSLVLSGSTS